MPLTPRSTATFLPPGAFRRPTLALVPLLLVLALSAPLLLRAQVLTSQYNNARTGANLHETILTPANVNASHFGKLFSLRVDGDVYAEPLYMPQLEVPGKGTHNVVFVATEHDSVYAFDADGRSAQPLWKVNFLNPDAGTTTVPPRDVGCPFIRPEIGITSTPVIDLNSGTLYVLARTREKAGFLSSQYVQRLHALAVTTGVEKFGGPVVIRASVRGRGAGGAKGEIEFDALRENPRSSLLLANGKVYLTWASSCDVGPYHGWVMAYDAQNLKQAGVWNASPDAGESGIWAGDTGPAADSQGNVYTATGNGRFDAAAGGRDYGDSILKLVLDGPNLLVRDYFTPFNQEELNSNDNDLGSGGPVLLPDQPGAHPHLLLIAGKGGMVYVVDRNRMGHFHAGADSQVVEEVQLPGGGAFGAPAYWNQHVYYVASDDTLRDFEVERGLLKPVGRSGVRFIDPGATPAVSANGSKNAIVWAASSRHWNEPDG
ncbi:MAG TPA: pyrrolo-quinoline quinone, partial [Terriglobia bacterium]|nr:pyrrolo-quinoline quinone [Terriglobia bacterium]